MALCSKDFPAWRTAARLASRALDDAARQCVASESVSRAMVKRWNYEEEAAAGRPLTFGTTYADVAALAGLDQIEVSDAARFENYPIQLVVAELPFT